KRHSQAEQQGSAVTSVRPETSTAKTLMDIGTRRIFNEDHDIFRQSVRRFFQEEVVPHHKWEKAGEVSRELWEKAGEQGLLGVMIPEEHGGIGGDTFSAAITWEEMYCNCTGPGFALHSDIVMPYIVNYGSKEQIERFIPSMTAGKHIGAIAMTEPGAGDLQGVRTYAKKDGSDWILNGNKVFITNGWMADVVVVVTVTDREAKTAAHGISLFLVENGMKGFQKGRKLEKIGLKAQDTAELFFEDVRLPASALLGELNKGFYYLMNELPQQERLLIADMGISSCEFMFEETRNYVLQRKAFGKTVAHLQTVQHKLAELKTEICVGRVFMDNCLQLLSERRLDPTTASMAKFASELQNKVATECLQLHGGWGYMWEYPIAAFVDSRVQPIYGGTNEIMKELIARGIMSQK
uniref:Long-chain specific acyl-CoA dehydrogenase, mitochondrial n=1 Tax=Xiphophorus couchianus TaxID=32473 RepID=A0A3B5KTP4_9TELE